MATGSASSWGRGSASHCSTGGGLSIRRVLEAMVLDIRPVVFLVEAVETVVVTDGGAVEVASGT